MTYVCAEPDEVKVFEDNRGRYHKSREMAINASFNNDVLELWCMVWDALPSGKRAEAQDNILALRKFIARNPDMVRIMLGDRDAT